MAGSLFKGFAITGHRKIHRKLSKLTDKVQKKVVRKAMRQGMKPMLSEVRKNIPVDTGDTRRETKIRAGKRSRNSIEVNIKSKDDNFVPRFLEFGTSNAPAYPYLRPSFDAKADDVKRETMERLLDLIEEELKKGAK